MINNTLIASSAIESFQTVRGTLLNGKPSAVLLTYIHLHDKPDLDVIRRINWARIKHIPFAARCEPFVGRLMGKTCELGLLRKCCFTHSDGPAPHPAGEKCPAQETLYRKIFRMTETEYADGKAQRDHEKTDRKRGAHIARNESYNKMTKTAREAYDKKKMCGWWEQGRCYRQLCNSRHGAPKTITCASFVKDSGIEYCGFEAKGLECAFIHPTVPNVDAAMP